jgi:hypothetical protein
VLGEETVAAERLAYCSFCVGIQVDPRVADRFLAVAGDTVSCEPACS